MRMNADDARDYARDLIETAAGDEDPIVATFDRELADALLFESDGSRGSWSRGEIEVWGLDDMGTPWRILLHQPEVDR